MLNETPTLLRLFARSFSARACASISTLESARVVDDDTFAVETVILDRGYAEARKPSECRRKVSRAKPTRLNPSSMNLRHVSSH